MTASLLQERSSKQRQAPRTVRCSRGSPRTDYFTTIPGRLGSTRFADAPIRAGAALEFLGILLERGEKLGLSCGVWLHEGVRTPGLLDIIRDSHGAVLGWLSGDALLEKDEPGGVRVIEKESGKCLGQISTRIESNSGRTLKEVTVEKFGEEPFRATVGCSLRVGDSVARYRGVLRLPHSTDRATLSRIETPGERYWHRPLMGRPSIRAEGVMTLTQPGELAVALGYDLAEYRKEPARIRRRTLELPDLRGRVHVASETDPLRVVALGNPDTYRLYPWLAQVHNVTQASAVKHLDPNFWREVMRWEFSEFERLLKAHGVIVLYPDPTTDPFVQGQQTIRDTGAVLGKAYVEGELQRSRRRREHLSFEPILRSLGLTSWRKPPPGSILEMGDVTIHNNKVLVGVGGQRTNRQGVQFLKNLLEPTIPVIPVPLQPWVLHLDCVLTAVSEDEALIFKEGLAATPKEVRAYKPIPVSEEDYKHLGPNVVPIGHRTIFASDTTPNVNESLERAGFKVVRVPFRYTEEAGGSLRCCSLPLVRTTLTLEEFLAQEPATREMEELLSLSRGQA